MSSEVDKLITSLTEAVSFYYSEDPCKPGILISYVSEGYYVAIHRYTEKYGSGKEIVSHNNHTSLKIALEKLSLNFLSQINKASPIERLRQYVVGSKL